MKPKLLFPFTEEKSIKTMQPNEEGLDPDQSWGYKIFPKLDKEHIVLPK
jgi:hypothetical protein